MASLTVAACCRWDVSSFADGNLRFDLSNWCIC